MEGCVGDLRRFLVLLRDGFLFKMPEKCHGILFLSAVNCSGNLNKLNILFCVFEMRWGNSASLA